MPPIRRKNTRSRTIPNTKNKSNKRTTSLSVKENAIDDACEKTNGTKRNNGNGKQIFDQENVGLEPDQMTTNSSIGESIFTTLQPVPLDLCNNSDDPSPSPRALVIEPTEEIISPQVPKSNGRTQGRPSGIANISRTPFARKNTKRLFNNIINYNSSSNVQNDTNEEENMINDLSKCNRTSTIAKNKPVMYSQIQDESIVVSVEKSQRHSTVESSYSRCRTSTPLYPSRLQQMNNPLIMSNNESFSINSISPESLNTLSRFPEFRKLVKAYNNEQQKCRNWINDYGRLKRKYDQLEANSFPRPSAPALDFLLELVTKIQQTGGQDDPRTDEQLASDIGVNMIILSGLKDSSPQQTALNLFNHIYPSYYAEVKLDSMIKMEQSRPGLLDSILVFAQRSAPGVRYTMQCLKTALCGNIRSARFQLGKTNSICIPAMEIMQNNGPVVDALQQSINRNDNDDDIPDNIDMEMDQ